MDRVCWPARGAWLPARSVQVLGNRAPSDVQMTGDLANRPFLDPVQAVNLVDLIQFQHRQIFLYGGGRSKTRTMFFSRSRPGSLGAGRGLEMKNW
jgi:hypothetical protein